MFCFFVFCLFFAACYFQATKVERIHKPCGFAYKIVTKHSKFKKPVQVYRGEDAAEQFILSMHKEYNAASSLLNMEKPMGPITRQQWNSHKAATTCYMCQEPFKDTSKKCFDHCHYRYATLNYSMQIANACVDCIVDSIFNSLMKLNTYFSDIKYLFQWVVYWSSMWGL